MRSNKPFFTTGTPPDPSTKLSPAQCIFGRPIKDFIPILPGRYKPHPTWSDTLAAREEALRNRHMQAAERWTEHTKKLPPLVIGDRVRIQNQTGPHPTRWDKTGTVIEVRQFDQYVVRVDGSGRITTRNRKFLRKYIPIQRQTPRYTISEDLQLTTRSRPTTQSKLPPQPQTKETTTQPIPNSSKTWVEPDPPSNTPCKLSESTPHPTQQDQEKETIDRSHTEDTTGLENTTKVTSPSTPQAEEKKLPLALRRLLDYNKKGLQEQ